MKNLLNVRRHDRQYQFGAALVLYEIAAVFVLLCLYLIIGIYVMAFVTFLSVLMCLTCYYFFVRGKAQVANVIGMILILYTGFIGDYLLGWQSGYHYYIVCMFPLIIASESLSRRVKIASLPVLIVVYAVILQIIMNTKPSVALPYPVDGIIGELNMFLAVGAIAFALFWYSAAAMQNEDKLKDMGDKMNLLANTDQLTGLPNRRCLYQRISQSMNGLGAEYDTIVLGMADIDDFKRINDTYGHLCGDEVLVEMSDRIKRSLRKHDVVGRWGGEEFLFILPDTGLVEGTEIIERIQRAIKEEIFVECGSRISVTMTIGIVECMAGSVFSDVIRQIDKNLYAGKRSGKSCIVGHSVRQSQ